MAVGVKSLWVRFKAVLSHELHANLSPIRAALSLALGILIGFSPLYGLHTPIVIGLAFLFRLNRPLALVTASTTILPFVPFWVAAGIFTGKLVVPLDTACRIVAALRTGLPGHSFDTIIDAMRHLAGHLPVIRKAAKGSEELFLGQFMQWLIGCCVFAVASAAVAFVVSYSILKFLHVRRQRRAARKAGTADKSGARESVHRHHA
jgi:uncharacterized protein (DUF2062 family)